MCLYIILLINVFKLKKDVLTDIDLRYINDSSLRISIKNNSHNYCKTNSIYVK